MILIAYSVSLLAGKSQELERSGLKEVESRVEEIVEFVWKNGIVNWRNLLTC